MITGLKLSYKLFVPLLLVPFLLFSQAQKELSLKEAIVYALQNKADAKKAKLQVENSEYQIQEARSGALPDLSANGNITYNPILQETAISGDYFGTPGTTVTIPFGQKWSSVVGISLHQNLFDQSVFTGLKAAKTTREFYQINAQLTDEQVMEQVATAYYNVFIQREQLTTVDSSYANIQKTRNIIKGLFENGLAKRIDLDRVNVQLTNIKTTRQQLINAVELQENALKFYIGMPIAQPIILTDNEFTIDKILLNEKISIENRTEFQVLRKQEELLQLQKAAYKALYYPTLSLSASYNYLGQGKKFPLSNGMSEGVYWSDYSSIGLNLNIPIFTGFRTRAKVNQADIDLQSLKEDIADTELALDLEYQNAKSQIQNSLIAVESQQQNMELAHKVLNDTQNNYQQGLASLTDLLDAQNSLVEARNNYSNAILQYKIAEVQLLKSKGELNKLIQ